MENCLPRDSSDTVEPDAPDACWQTTIVTSVTVGTDQCMYYVRRRVEVTLPLSFQNPSPETVVPAVVLHHRDDGGLSLDAVLASIHRFLQTDDVFQHSFTKHAVLLVTQPSAVIVNRVPADLLKWLESGSLTLCFFDGRAVPEGPYFIVGHQLHQAWRLYPDNLRAFSNTVVPDDTAPSGRADEALRHFQSLRHSAFTGHEGSVAVPSRLYFAPTDEKPLNGQRIAIKDNIDLAGVVTGLGSKAYAELYGERSESAKLIQTLLENGAVVVGKTKLSAFAGSEVPPTQCIDYFPPWNARGDGYQGPSGSSSGAGSAAAGYEWLDHSIGTDTTGSIRFPATSHGVWGLRSTWNSLPVGGVVPSCSTFDAIGLLGRTASAIGDLLAACGQRLAENNASWPTRILYPIEWFPVADEDQQGRTDAFLAALESSLGVNHQKISLQEEWHRTGPETLRHRTLLDIVKSARLLNLYDSKHNLVKFGPDYQDKFGKSPYISPSQLERWNEIINTTQEERDQALEEVEQFRAWAQKTLFSTRSDGSSSIIMLVPHGRPGANYRDTEPSPASGPALDPVLLVSAMGTPQLLIPIGQNPYQSRVSKQEEFAPIFTTIVGGPHTDLTLLKVAQETIVDAGWPSTVLTGRFMF